MTLLAAFTAFEIPILVGDLLITRNFSRDSTRKKIHILSSNCVIGWTGFLDSAEIVFKKLFEEIDSNNCELSVLEETLTSFSADEFKGSPVKLVGWIVEETVRCFRWDSRIPKRLNFPESAFDGSAGVVLQNMMEDTE